MECTVGEISSRVCVIGSEYCSSETVELAVVRKVMPAPEKTILVGDNNYNIVFKMEVQTSDFDMHEKRVLLDSHGTPILTFRDKFWSLRSRWSVYKGKSTDKKDLIFIAKQSKMTGSKKELNVYLASNKDKKACDFKVSSSSDKFYVGGSDQTIIAETRDFTIKIYPNIDQAFIISLIVILDGINLQRQQNNEIRAQAVTAGGQAFTSGIINASYGAV